MYLHLTDCNQIRILLPTYILKNCGKALDLEEIVSNCWAFLNLTVCPLQSLRKEKVAKALFNIKRCIFGVTAEAFYS